MMYKLINTITNEEHLCEKITIDGFDYYITISNITNGECYLHKKEIKQFLNSGYDGVNFKKVIATNNPNINSPQLINEVEKLGEIETNIRILRHQVTSKSARTYFEGFMNGFGQGQKNYQFTENDMIEFTKWLRIEDTEKNAEKYANFSDLDMLNFWKENQQIKTLYYENKL